MGCYLEEVEEINVMSFGDDSLSGEISFVRIPEESLENTLMFRFMAEEDGPCADIGLDIAFCSSILKRDLLDAKEVLKEQLERSVPEKAYFIDWGRMVFYVYDGGRMDAKVYLEDQSGDYDGTESHLSIKLVKGHMKKLLKNIQEVLDIIDGKKPLPKTRIIGPRE